MNSKDLRILVEAKKVPVEDSTGVEEWDTGELPSEPPPECAPNRTLQMRIEELGSIVAVEDFDQTLVVEEECVELLKEICKLRRGKGVRENLVEETVDVITACLVYAGVCGVDVDYILDHAHTKIDRAIERYRKSGEM